MKVVFMLKQSRNLLLMTGGYEPRFGEHVFQILDYIVAFDVDCAIVNEHRSQSTWIDAQKPRLDVLVGQQIDGMRLPIDTLQIEEDPNLLRARRSH
jgi:hypothetical protein